MLPAEDRDTYPPEEHLKSSLLIKSLVDDNNVLYNYPIKCYYRIKDALPSSHIQLAVVTPKRRFHHAVDRNRIKRLMREAYRLHKSRFLTSSPYDLQMCWIFVGKEVPSLSQVEKSVDEIFAKLSQLKPKRDDAKTV